MKNLEEKEIKQFSEFTEVTPESSQNLITDRGRFTVGALFNAVVGYAADLINAAVQAAQSAASQSAQNAQTSAAQASVSAEAAESAKTQSQGYAEEAETIVSDGLEAVQAARDSALQDIEVYTDPDGRISNSEKTTSKVGRFYVNGGNAQRKINQFNTVPFSLCFSYAKPIAWINGEIPFIAWNVTPGAGQSGIAMYIVGGLTHMYFEIGTTTSFEMS